jgi:uncharacterized protein (DUF488 family)
MNLFTIGYEGLDQRQFMAHLAHNKISVVADVRHLPLSRKKGFSKSSLAEMLNENDIEYISLRDLGTSKDMRNKLYATKNYAAFFKDYKRSIADQTPNPIYLICGLRISHHRKRSVTPTCPVKYTGPSFPQTCLVD